MTLRFMNENFVLRMTLGTYERQLVFMIDTSFLWMRLPFFEEDYVFCMSFCSYEWPAVFITKHSFPSVVIFPQPFRRGASATWRASAGFSRSPSTRSARWASWRARRRTRSQSSATSSSSSGPSFAWRRSFSAAQPANVRGFRAAAPNSAQLPRASRK